MQLALGLVVVGLVEGLAQGQDWLPQVKVSVGLIFPRGTCRNF
jgi:hypothetical protein